MTRGTRKPLPLKSVNHVARNCRDLPASLAFYERVLGFVPIKRPGSFDYDGAWLHNYDIGVGIHLLQIDNKELGCVPPVKKEINPHDDHISFQCEDILLVQAMLQENGIRWMPWPEDDREVKKVFFHDPDGFMIEICT